MERPPTASTSCWRVSVPAWNCPQKVWNCADAWAKGSTFMALQLSPCRTVCVGGVGSLSRGGAIDLGDRGRGHSPARPPGSRSHLNRSSRLVSHRALSRQFLVATRVFPGRYRLAELEIEALRLWQRGRASDAGSVVKTPRDPSSVGGRPHRLSVVREQHLRW